MGTRTVNLEGWVYFAFRALSWSFRRVFGASILKTEFGEHLKPRSQYVDDAVQLAIAGRWEEAVELNRFIIDKFGGEEDSHNRLGKAMSELGKFGDAKKSYEATIALNPMNPIAQKNLARLEVLSNTKGDFKIGLTKVDLNLFVEEMGKTIGTTLTGVDDPQIGHKVSAGDIAELRVSGDQIVAETVRGVRLGTIESRLARRLIKFIQGGNRYMAAVTAIDNQTVKLMVRETFQDPKFTGKPSFPVRRKREVEFRPYAKTGLLGRNVDAFDDDGEEPEVVDSAEESEDDVDAVVADEDTESLDFSEDDDGDDDERPEDQQ